MAEPINGYNNCVAGGEVNQEVLERCECSRVMMCGVS